MDRSKEEPIIESEPIKEEEKEHTLQKVDDAWLTPNNDTISTAQESISNQWDLPTEEKEEKHQQTEQAPIHENEEKDELPVNFNSLSLEETNNVPETKT